MRANFWLREQERLAPGFLRRAYADRPFTDANDAEVARHLAALAELHGATLTADVVGKARLELGLRRCKSGRKAARLVVEHLPASLPDMPAPAAPEQPALPGIDARNSLEKATWALNGAVRELRLEIQHLRTNLEALRGVLAAQGKGVAA